MNTHPLTADRWAVPGESEHGKVLLSHVHQIERARIAITTIARMVGNSASEPFGSGATPLDECTVIALLGGVESLCDHLGDLADQMLEQARSMREHEGAQ